jgi:hypothetical protein
MRIGAYAKSLMLQLRAAQGLRGAARVLRVVIAKRVGGAGHEADPVEVPMKALGGGPILVRPGTSDLRNTTYYYSEHLYLPPPQLVDEDLRQICELGSNMGAALTALAHRYPAARLFGVEPDAGNAMVASRNVARFGDRVAVIEAGIWDSVAELVVDRETRYGEHGFMVRERRGGDGPEASGITALSLDTLLARHMPDGIVDYAHMTIEATEPRVLKAGGEWPRRVRSMRVEAHPEFGYPATELVADLERLGYEAWPDRTHPDKWVYGLKTLS